MERTPVNPTDWGLQYRMNQGEIVEGATRYLRCSGQVDLTPDPDAELGLAVVAPGDMRAQMEGALGNVDELLSCAGMNRSDIVFIHFFTTDIAAFLGSYEVYDAWISKAGIMPPQSLLGVAELAVPGLVVEIEVTAAE